jgi:hypothetical protein
MTINELIAVHIMGWIHNDRGEWKMEGDHDDQSIYKWQLPNYSTDISYAWQVIDKLADMKYVLHIKADGLRPNGQPRYTALCGNRPRTDHASAPMAICLMALKIVGVEV